MLIFAAAMCAVAALASWLRGGKFVHHEAHASHAHEHVRPQTRTPRPDGDGMPDPAAAWARASRDGERRPLDL